MPTEKIQEMRRATDSLPLSDEQKSFLDRVCVNVVEAVQEAIQHHEDESRHLAEDEVAEVVRMTISGGNVTLAGRTPEQIVRSQINLERRHDALDRNVDKILDVVVGPVREDWKGDPDEQGERDTSKGLMAQTQIAVRAAEKLDMHLSNGGVPVKLPANVKAAIWTAAGAIVAAGVTGTALIITALV